MHTLLTGKGEELLDYRNSGQEEMAVRDREAGVTERTDYRTLVYVRRT